MPNEAFIQISTSVEVWHL